MLGNDILDALVALGGLGGVGALVTSLVNLAKVRQVSDEASQARADSAMAAAQLRPDHGHSVSDRLDLTLQLVRSQGHQLGEIRTDLDAERDERRDLAHRVERIENRPMDYPWDRRDSANGR